ncbi:PREDICTED: nucleolar protein 8, partial [Nestor notabilis]|uniref:nucleolar protein 8 n=1 Tax=Nestor notabilis TaxID=176057 RepID=UPI000523D27D
REREVQKAENGEAESDHLEIVGDNFELKCSNSWSSSNPDAMKQALTGSFREKETMECDNGYQSADTDEIVAESKIPRLHSRNCAVLEDCKQVKAENEEILTGKKSDLVNDSSVETHNLKEYVGKKGKMKKSQTGALQSTAGNSTMKTSDSESSCSEPEKGESEISLDYECMMQNCYRLDLTLDDLQALATETRGAESDSTQSSSQHSVEEYPKGNVANETKLSKFCPAVRKKCICPEDVLAAILVGEEDVDEASSKGQNNLRLKYQPFRGMGSLCEKESPRGSTGLEKGSAERLDLEPCVSSCGGELSQRQRKNHPMYSPEPGSKKRQNTRCEPQEELSDAASLADERGQPVSRPHLQGKNQDASSTQGKQKSENKNAAPCTGQGEDESSDMDSNAAASQRHAKRQLKSPRLLSKRLKLDVSNQSPEREADKHEDGKRSLLENKELCLHATASKERRPKKKQLQDNQRRLAALGERQRERELQKK